MDEKKINLIKKLQALADQGVGGEQETAKRKLAELMTKYGIDDLSGEWKELREFTYRSKYEKRLLNQIFYKYGFNSYTKKWGKGSRSTILIDCTDAQYLQIQIEYEFYRELWKEENEFLFKAFVNKHNIFPADGEVADRKLADEELWRLVAMIAGMQDKSLTPAIETSLKGAGNYGAY